MDTIIFSFSLSIDAFLMSISYGLEKIKIPLKANFLISFLGSLILGFSLYCSNILKNILSPTFCLLFSFSILFLLGCYRLVENYTKKKLNEQEHNRLIQVYSNEILADFDNSKYLSLKEATYLGITLSLDSFASGIGVGLTTSTYIYFLVTALLINIIMIILGCKAGIKLQKISNKISWLSGILLIILAFLKLI